MKLPKEFRVGTRVYDITSTRAGIDAASVGMRNELYGMTNNDQMTVVIDPRSNIARKRETLLHEVLHTCTDIVGIDKEMTDETEEKVVNRLAPVLLAVLRDNPRLVAYLTAP